MIGNRSESVMDVMNKTPQDYLIPLFMFLKIYVTPIKYVKENFKVKCFTIYYHFIFFTW